MSNSEPESEAEPKLKAEENSDNVVVVDPDDYQKTKQLEGINRAKEAVRKAREEKPLRANQDEWDGIHARTAERVSDYARELWPLIQKAKEEGLIEESDLEAATIEISKFMFSNGRVPETPEEDEWRRASESEYMAIYTQLSIIEDKLGLGLELETDKGPAEI